jgi:hypothetical protein
MGEKGAASSTMAPLVVMVVNKDHGMLWISHAPALVIHPTQLSKLLVLDAVCYLK